MRFDIKCPKCGTDSVFFLANTRYQGPYRCWKCSEYSTLKIRDNELKSCEPLSQTEFNRQKELKAAKAAARRKSSNKD